MTGKRNQSRVLITVAICTFVSVGLYVYLGSSVLRVRVTLTCEDGRIEEFGNTALPEIKEPHLLTKVGLDGANIDVIDDTVSENSKPVIVSATSSNHFTHTVKWIKNMMKLRINLRLIIYDIGMTTDQRQNLCTSDKCEIRTFQYELFSIFIKNNPSLIAWKPLIIQLCLQEFGFVIWMDSAIRLKNGNIEHGLDVAKREGIAIPYNVGTFEYITLPYTTSILTFQSFQLHPCTLYGEFLFNAGIVFVRKTKFVMKNIMLPWVACALSEDCIGGGHTAFSTCTGANRVGYCHHFDSSALSIILHGLYRNHEEKMKIDLTGKVDWIKCYDRPRIVVMDGEAFVDRQHYNELEC